MTVSDWLLLCVPVVVALIAAVPLLKNASNMKAELRRDSARSEVVAMIKGLTVGLARLETSIDKIDAYCEDLHDKVTALSIKVAVDEARIRHLEELFP